ncbi:MAG: phenylalanine--tRNA ligase subunit beta [Gemmatimonadota bacterium]
MNTSVAWLNAFLDSPKTAVELRDLLTAHTATVEELIALRADLASIVVAKVITEAPHPDSDHLHITKVDDGSGELLDVVCGAPNVTAGKFYPFARTGTTLPGGLTLTKRKIRGQTSNGMLCSARELELGDEHDGIMELDVDVAPGTPFLEAVSVGDTRLIVDVLPNRPDLLSHLGVAREISALTGASLSLPDIGATNVVIPEAKRFRRAGNAGGIVLHLEDAKLATRFMGIVIRGVKVGPSPAWLVERLIAVGSRSINNVVDATNYVLHELGQPTHAYDFAKIDPEPKMPEKTIVVRSAKNGETLVTLDGVTRTLTPEMSVIADSVNAIGIAGVMGGRDTEVTEETTDVFVEAATFDAPRTRRTRRAAGLSTDASYRFERGVDVALAPRALERVASLIVSLAGGTVVHEPVDLHAGEAKRVPLVLRTSRVARVLGVALDAARIAELLRLIGCTADAEDGGTIVHVVAPTWRRDLVSEADLIEEIARLHGYDALPTDIRPYRPGTSSDAPLWTLSAKLRELLSGAGFLEARPIPFVAGGEGHVRISNPLAENEGHLRRTLLETLARRAEHNLAHMQGNVRLYEIGSVFAPGAEALPLETVNVALLLMGDRDPAHFTNAKPARFDAWDAKGLAAAVATAAFGNAILEPSADGGDVLWNVVVGGQRRGIVTRVALDAPVWASPAFGVEIELSALSNADIAPAGEHAHGAVAPEPPRAVSKYRALPTTPASVFDLALLVPETVIAADVERVIRSSAGELLEQLMAFDVYEGAGVDAGHRSVAWRLTLRHPERTLRDKEIEGRRAKILTALQSELNVRQRST